MGNLKNSKKSGPSKVYENGIEFRTGEESLLKYKDIKLIKETHEEKKERRLLVLKDKTGTKYVFSDGLVRYPRSVYIEDIGIIKKILKERASNAKWV